MEADVSELGRVPAPPKPRAPARAGSAKWAVAALLLLSVVPIAAGAYRLSQLIGGATDWDDRGGVRRPSD